jgi:hypothetical protein
VEGEEGDVLPLRIKDSFAAFEATSGPALRIDHDCCDWLPCVSWSSDHSWTQGICPVALCPHLVQLSVQQACKLIPEDYTRLSVEIEIDRVPETLQWDVGRGEALKEDGNFTGR